MTATSHNNGVLHAQAEIVFVHLNAPSVASFFEPETFLQMMHMLGAFQVGHAADGSPLDAAAQPAGPRSATRRRRQPAPWKENSHETARRGHRHRLRHPAGRRHRNHVAAAARRANRASDYTTRFDASNFPTKISAEVRDWDLSDVGENPEDWKFQGRHTHFAVGAAKKAMADSGVQHGPLDPTRFGVYTGAGEGQQDFNRFTEMMVAGLWPAARRWTWAASPRPAWNCSIPSPSWSRSPTCRPPTWPACSTPRDRTSTA